MTETTSDVNDNTGNDAISPQSSPETDNIQGGNEATSVEDEVRTTTNETVAPVTTSHAAGEYFTIDQGSPNPNGVKCRFLPHGMYAVVPALFSTFAWLCSLSQDGCDYARLTGPIVSDITNNAQVPFLDVGFNQYREPTRSAENSSLWEVDYRLPCRDYNPDVVNMDGYWKFSKGTAFLSLVFGGGAALFLWFSSCFIFSRGTWHWAGYELLAATIFQALSFLWFKTSMCHGNDGEDKCTLFYGSKADIMGSAFWFVSMLAVFCKYPKARTKVVETSTATFPTDLEMTDQTTTGAGTDNTREII